MSIKSNKSIINATLLWMINLFFISSFLIWISQNWSNNQVISLYNKKLFPWVCGLMLVQILSFRIKKVPLYDFGIWFVGVSYLFMFGYMFRDIFGLESVLIWNPIVNYANKELFHTYIFVILSLELFTIGYLAVYKKNNILKLINFKEIYPDIKIYNTGLILLLIGGISKILNDITVLLFMQSANTYSAYSDAVVSGIMDDFACLMLPGIFFIFFSGCIKEKKKTLIFIIILAYLSVIMVLTGSRKTQIFSILSLFLGYIYSSEKKQFSLLKIISCGFLGLVILNVIITVRDYRFNLREIGPVIIEKIFSFDLFGNILGEILAETGITLLSVASIITLIPSVIPYQYGLTYLRTLPSFLPIGWLVGDFFNLASSTYVVNTYINIPAGSSFIGDLYWNWGVLGGLVASMVSGVLFSKFLQIKCNSNIRKELALYFSIFAQLIMLVRSEVIDVYRPIIMIIIAVYVLEKLNFIKWRIKI